MSTTDTNVPIAFTKLIATLGPASRDPETLADLIRCGVDVFRLNMAHGSREEHERTLADIRAASATVGRPIGVLVDLAGPKIRLGKLINDPTTCEPNATFTFIRGEKAASADQLTASYDRLLDELSVDDRVMLADGTVSMIVTDKTADSVTCRVQDGGDIRTRQGINLPGVTLSVPTITDTDREQAIWAAENDIDFVGLSFVRGTEELHDLKSLLESHGSSALVIAKIEKNEALEQLDDIVLAADGIMVARGDLGVEIDVAEIAVAQKRIIETCKRLGRPVIVATQMLDSMHDSPRPTRAEVTDVANAILDGADACMLSGETAIGQYPHDAVRMMNRIMLATERGPSERLSVTSRTHALPDLHPITSAVVSGATQIAEQLSASLVVVATRSGATALAKAKQRDFTPTVGVSLSEQTLRRMCLYWGIIPVAGAPADNPPALRCFINEWSLGSGLLKAGDRIVSITGTGIVPGAQNSIVIHEAEDT